MELERGDFRDGMKWMELTEMKAIVSKGGICGRNRRGGNLPQIAKFTKSL